MSELKATPGEWRWEDHEGDGQWLVSDEEGAEDGFGWIILETGDVKPEDASLLAASRKMYSILERLEKFCDDVTDENTYLYSEAKKLSSEIDDLLTQARGEQQ